MPRTLTATTRTQGFSLIEMAVVLMIIGTLLSGVLVAVGNTTESTRRTNALAQLRLVEEALYGFAQSTGRLPCPATVANAGREDPVGGGTCTNWHGFVPAATLGISGAINSDGLLLDPWQNPLRYSVSWKTIGINEAFTTVAGLKALFTDAGTQLVAGADMLQVCDTTNCTGITLADTVPALVLSMGANWASFTSAEETENTDGGASNDFVTTTYSEDNFDDQLVWLSPHILFNRLISAGKLP